MADERSYYHLNDYGWGEDCSEEHYGTDPYNGGTGKGRDAVDVIYQLLQSGQPFTSEKARELELPHHETAESKDAEKARLQVAATPVSQTTEPPPTTQPDTQPATDTTLPNSSTKSNKSLKHTCETCKQVFDSRIALSIHAGRIHKTDGRDKTHQCPRCPKTFHNSSYLSQHMRIHTGIKPYKCNMCNKAFTQLSHLQQHKRTHSGEKPYRCTQPGCTKAFSQLSNLQSHTRSHLQDGNVHKCTSCYKCYFDEKSLNAHLRTHMMSKRVRNYKCPECPKSFTQDTYLQNHINNKHRGGTMDKLSFTPRPLPSSQPTSIQAATSMICKVEDQSTTPCTGANSLSSPLMQRAQSHSMMSAPLTGEQSSGYSKDYRAEANYQRPPTFTTSGEEQHCSAFKPPTARPNAGMDVSQSQVRTGTGSQGQQRSVNTGYDQINNNILGLVASQDVKPAGVERQPQESEMLWKIRNNMAAAASIGSYTSFNSQIQQYMASGGGYPPSSYSAYLNSSFDNIYADKIGNYSERIGGYADKLGSSYTDMIGSYADKLGSSGSAHGVKADMFDYTADDYFMMGGNRDGFSMD